MSLYFGGTMNPFFKVINYMPFRITAAILVIVSIIVLGLTVFNYKNENCGFSKLLRDFFNFDALCIGKIIKALYLIIFLYYTIYGLLLLFVNPLMGLTYLVVYNIIARLAFELVMIFVKIEENTNRKNCKCNCDDCDCDCECDCNCGCNCDCEYEDIDLDEDFDENDATVIIEDITDEVIEDMRIAEEEAKEKKTRKKKETKE